MPDDTLRRRLVLDRTIVDLTAERHAAKIKLCEAIARENDMPLWLALDEQARKRIIEEATSIAMRSPAIHASG